MFIILVVYSLIPVVWSMGSGREINVDRWYQKLSWTISLFSKVPCRNSGLPLFLCYCSAYDAKPECNSKQKRQAAGLQTMVRILSSTFRCAAMYNICRTYQLVNMKTLFDSHSPDVQSIVKKECKQVCKRIAI